MTTPPADDGRTFDLLAYGDPNVDYLFEAAVIPGPDQKVLGRNLGIFAGGTVANVACAASRLGANVASYGRVGSDAGGKVLRRDYDLFGVSSQYVKTVDYPSAAAMIMIDASGEKALIYAPMPADPLDEARFAEAARRSRLVYAMPYDLEEFRRVAAIAHDNGADVAIDIEAAVAPDTKRLDALLSLSDIVFMNEGGFRATQTGDISEVTVRPLVERGPRMVVVTMAEKGALAVTRDKAWRQAAFPARLVDATGAGDCFNGAFLAATLAGRSVADSLAFACAAASLAVSAVGARGGMPDRSVVEAMLG
ncbi:carbohydrate kinase family protein [Pleomorphomonas sp. PLEO]|uniref:carbohydrate kinase family protein n=1 Tax=Pleomorphomonas sp. PLEO TaxID=3239306 RepID=UPI00351EEDE7